MEDRMKIRWNILLTAVMIVLFLVLSVLLPDQEISMTERRKLHRFPELRVESILGQKAGTSFMDEFEIYAKDQFPFRESFRRMHSLAGRILLGRREINDLYLQDGFLVKLEDGIHEKDLEWSADRISYIINKYTSKNNIALAVVPDKNYYLAPAAGVPRVDCEELTALLGGLLPEQVRVADLADLLCAEDYYRTDTHWRQEAVTDIADRLLEFMGRPTGERYEMKGLPGDFYGVYYGQAALPIEPDQICYLTNRRLENYRVTCYDTGTPIMMDLYDREAAEGMDPYEFYMSGAKSLITIENPEGEGELVLFRDSFGSSLAPLLAAGYGKVTLVDIRYISPAMLGRFVDFEDADILFLYSAMVLNHSIGQFMK